ncbi:MAG: M1 family metallopeptidase [Chitinophagaceae bacterium]
MLSKAIFTCTVTLMFFSLLLTAQPGKEIAPPNTSDAQKWWNLLHYSIAVTPDYNKQFITGTNQIEFSAIEEGKTLRIDLAHPMVITFIRSKGIPVSFKKENVDFYLIHFSEVIKKGQSILLEIGFEGKPGTAKDAPNDNGWIWASDKKGRPWMTIACQGSGPGIWLPCKDVLYDEPEKGVVISITVPDTLKAIANGRLQHMLNNKNGTTTWTWKVSSPINHYNIIPYIGKYVTWNKHYQGLNGRLDCDFWVLDYHLDRGKEHFKQTDTLLKAFEHWLGPYPFYKDGYKVVETPYPGMEHQSAIAYGNGFQNGFKGKDLFGTGWGLKWDFILVHESGHEWFGNSITSSNHSDTWIHEGFTKYLETIYTDFVFGTAAGNNYATGTWKRIKNDKPILGTGTTDQYYKASAMLHMIRQILGDSMFRGWLRQLGRECYHQTVTTARILHSLNSFSKKDFTKVFDQYLTTTRVPVLEYYRKDTVLRYRWTDCVDHFDMAVKVSIGQPGKTGFIYPATEWQEMAVGQDTGALVIDSNFYVRSREMDQ